MAWSQGEQEIGVSQALFDQVNMKRGNVSTHAGSFAPCSPFCP